MAFGKDLHYVFAPDRSDDNEKKAKLRLEEIADKRKRIHPKAASKNRRRCCT